MSCVIGHDAIKICLVVHYLLCLDLNVNRLAAGTAKGLVDHDAGVGHGETLALGAGTKQESTHGGSQAKADSLDVASAELNKVAGR